LEYVRRCRRIAQSHKGIKQGNRTLCSSPHGSQHTRRVIRPFRQRSLVHADGAARVHHLIYCLAMPKITVLPHPEVCPEGAVIDSAPVGVSICRVLLDNNIDIEHACELSCACTTCHVIIRDGFDALEEATDNEEDYLDRA